MLVINKGMMAKKFYTIDGFRDYRGVPLEDILEDLRAFEGNTKRAITKLEELYKEAKKNKNKLDDPESIINYVDSFLSMFEGLKNDFNRVVYLLEKEPVKEKHLDIINQIYEFSAHEYQYSTKEFKKEHIAKRLKDESIRPLLDRIHTLTSGVTYNHFILFKLNERLRTYLGESINESFPKIEHDKKSDLLPKPIDKFPTPQEVKWEDVKITFLSDKAIQINVMDKQEGKDYVELGFTSKRGGKMRKAWEVLFEFAFKDGEISYKDENFSHNEITKQLKTRIYELNKWFGLYFGIKGNAIRRYNRHTQSYKAKFEIHLHQNFREELGYL
jgi:hypothetical protein